MNQKRKPIVGIFWSTVISLVVAYLLLTSHKFGIPYFSMIITGKENPLPVPGAALVMYLLLALVGAFVYITYREERRQEFIRPIAVLLRGRATNNPGGKAYDLSRVAILVAFPLLIGWTVYSQTVPEANSPTGLRIQHPTIPGQYEKLVNPFRNPSDEVVKKFIEEEKLDNISLEKARAALVRKYIVEGRTLYQINCRPCHGTRAAADGPMARGFRLKPADFTDPGTIATVVEAYAFWRIKEGGPGLPAESSPWDSAMPRWKDELTDEQIWKIILAEYDTAGVEPRIPEKLHQGVYSK